MSARPLDALDKSKGKKVLIKLKNGSDLTGILQAFDLHLNIWLSDAELTDQNGKKKLGNLVLRGDTLEWISPE